MAKKIDEDILKPSIERYNSGESVKSISDNIGVSVNTIRRFLKKNGILHFIYIKKVKINLIYGLILVML